ncbi:MAG: hypothetical protein ACR5K6_02795 [Wolbachia sp.]
MFHLKNSEKVKNFAVDRVLPLLESFKDDITNLENESPAMMKFLCSTPEYEELHEGLKELSDLARKCDYVPGSESYKEFCSLVSEVVQGFKLPNLKDKIKFLGLLKVTKNLTATRKAYNDDWFFCDVINDKDFEEYVNEAVGEEDGPTSKGLKKDIDKCRGLIRRGEDIASKYFRKKEVIFQAYCEETEDDNKILNVNLINYDKSKPIRISDILRQEEDVDKLDILL